MPVDHSYIRLFAAIASNTNKTQDYITSWDSYVVPEAGTLRAVYFVASSLTSNSAVHKADIYLQPSGVAAASNSGTSVLTAPVTIAVNNTSVAGSIAQGNQRVAAGDILQLRTNEALVATGQIKDLRATVLVLPD